MPLVAALQVKEGGGEYRTLKLFGQEVNLITSAIARMNFSLHGIEDFKIVRGDTLSNPAFIEKDHLKQFDVVLANPPYSIKQWSREAWSSDPYGRNIYGVPPQGRADYAFFQHIIASMNTLTGRCAILFPHGVLFRDEEQKMREKLIEADVIECVLGLGPNLFYNSPMEACVVVCRMKKPSGRKGKILFINAVNEVTRERSQSFLKEDHIQKVLKAYRDFKDIEGFTKVASNDEIRAHQSSLSIALYVRPINGYGNSVEKPIKDAITEWQQSSETLRNSMESLFVKLNEAGFNE